MEITVDYLKDKVHEQYLELQELRKSYDELTKSALRLDKIVKEKQEEIDQLKAREEEYQRLNGELREENERSNKRNKEIYEGFMATTEELCETAKEVERLNNIINKAREYIENHNKLEKELGGTIRFDIVKLSNILKGVDKE